MLRVAPQTGQASADHLIGRVRAVLAGVATTRSFLLGGILFTAVARAPVAAAQARS